jgi:glycosyltransferase involved in cell wall biosynthesis
MYQYIPWLEARGMKVCSFPLLDNSYLHALYSGRKQNLSVLAGRYLKRAARLLESGSYDLIWIEKELFPYFPAWGERLLNLLNTPYIVDYDDATFHNYDLHRSGAIRLLLGKKIDSVMKHAALVTVGNDYLAGRASEAGAGKIEYLPTVIDLDRYPVGEKPTDRPFTVGWIGSPFTGKYLRKLQPVFGDICGSGPARLILIGISDAGFTGIPIEYRAWSEETEAGALSECDVGIMPLIDGPWEQGKCGYKLIQYMACGLPVIASPVGINREIVAHGVTGFLADTTEEWTAALATLRDDPGLRRRMGEAGRKRVEEHYCLQVTAPRLADLMTNLHDRQCGFSSTFRHGNREKQP